MTDQQSKLEKMAQSLYSAHISNHPAIHCNRFPSWAELTNASRKHWVATAKFADAFREDNGDKGRENPAEAPTNRNTDPIWQALWELAEAASGPHELSRGEMVDRAWQKVVGEREAVVTALKRARSTISTAAIPLRISRVDACEALAAIDATLTRIGAKDDR